MQNRRSALVRALVGFVALGVLLVACGGDDDEATADAPTAGASAAQDADADGDGGASDTDDTDATDATDDDAAPRLPGAPTVEAPGTGMFASTVEPVIERTCAGCHGVGGPGAPHVLLETAGDAALYAPDLALLVEARIMPPWPASEESVPFLHPMSLTAEERQAILDWAAAGAPLDVDPDEPLTYTGPAFPDPAADVVMTAAAPYQGSVDKRDDYRCFALDTGLEGEAWLTGYGFRADQPEIVHHAVIFKASAAYRPIAEQVDSFDEAPGWECFGLSGLENMANPDGSRVDGRVQQIGGWAPGLMPIQYPDGASLPLAPGDFFVIQLHYHYETPDPPADLSEMWIDVTDTPTPREVLYDIYLGPAEIPCTAEQAGNPRCDRDVAIAEIEQNYGLFATFIPDGLIGQCGADLAALMDNDTGVASSTCDLRVRQTGDLVAVFGHMHEYGAAFRMTLNPDTPDETVLLDIPRWDFDWQLSYGLVDPIPVGADDVLRIECTWDRSLVEDDEARYITWAEGTGDEMCYSSISVIS